MKIPVPSCLEKEDFKIFMNILTINLLTHCTFVEKIVFRFNKQQMESGLIRVGR